MNKKVLLLSAVFFMITGIVVFSQENYFPDGYPPQAVLVAAYGGNMDLMKEILATDIDRDVRDSLGGTALHVAVLSNHLEMILLLLDYGFDVNATVPLDGYEPLRGFTPLHYCVWTNNLNAANILLQYKADKNIKAANGQTPVDKATREGKRDLLLLFARR